jgi:carbon monoxide dehydrogenase subunit G
VIRDRPSAETIPMARYVATVETRQDPAEVFAYLSDFSTTAEWDPGVSSARRLDQGPVRKGSRFQVTASFMGRDVPLTYEIVELETPDRVVLRAESATIVSLDEIRTEPHEIGARVTYDARLTLRGPLRLADPLLGAAFKRIGDRAAKGLRNTLQARARSARAPAA